MNYRETHLQPGKGQTYHKAFFDNPYRNMVWQFEKSILDHILSIFYRNTEIHHFDFACGTGRILLYLEDRVTSSIGVDLSPSMLEVANENRRRAEIIGVDLTRNDVLGDRKFNLITAFRFFPNAEADLRMEAMQVLTKHLDKNGFIVFNNHKNTGSIRNRLARLFGHRDYTGMSNIEVRELLLENHLEIVKTYHLSVFPASEKNMLLPLIFLRYLEGILSRIPSIWNFGGNIIFVCQRSLEKFDKRE